MNYDNNYLAHYGVLGMHWGIRRYQPYSTKPRGSGKGGKEIGEAKKKNPSGSGSADKGKKAIKTVGKMAVGTAIGAGAAYAGSKLAFNAAVQYYLHKPAVDAAVKKAYKQIKKLSLNKYTKKTMSVVGAAEATKKLMAIKGGNKSQARPHKDNPVTRRAAAEIMNELKDKKISEIDKGELQRSVQFLNNLERIEMLSRK